ncbi:hypothetical protein ACFYM2_07630 [Streptomyces sp. NPDC006711]|uniref:hypothetical protein n=1 Tax=unclassified Streptomyces TaxID=2593676 RepID=UPI003407B8F2
MRVIVHPGSPAAADVLFPFRLFPVAAQLLPWAAIGPFYGPLAERPLGPCGAAAGAGTRGPAPVAA